jgi:hypothetical protein
MMGEQPNQLKAIFLAAIDEYAPESWPQDWNPVPRAKGR